MRWRCSTSVVVWERRLAPRLDLPRLAEGVRRATRALWQQVIFNEEYARAGGPGRLGHIGEELLGPTLIAFGTEAQKKRFLPPIIRGGASSGARDTRSRTPAPTWRTCRRRAELDGDEWVITGQKIWTSRRTSADWCFVLCRTDSEGAEAQGHLVPPRAR